LVLLVGAALVVPVAAIGVRSARAQQPATAPRPAAPYDSILTTSIRDIQDFWSEQMPAVYGVRYQALPKSHINAYTSKTDMSSITDCARGGATYKDFQHNAFHCPLDMTVNFDNQDLFPGLYKKFGAFTLAQVLSHEWGHVIQTQTGTEFPATVLAETQADCFAGAWVEHVDSGDSKLLQLDPATSIQVSRACSNSATPSAVTRRTRARTDQGSTASTRSSKASRVASHAAPSGRTTRR